MTSAYWPEHVTDEDPTGIDPAKVFETAADILTDKLSGEDDLRMLGELIDSADERVSRAYHAGVRRGLAGDVAGDDTYCAIEDVLAAMGRIAQALENVKIQQP